MIRMLIYTLSSLIANLHYDGFHRVGRVSTLVHVKCVQATSIECKNAAQAKKHPCSTFVYTAGAMPEYYAIVQKFISKSRKDETGWQESM